MTQLEPKWIDSSFYTVKFAMVSILEGGVTIKTFLFGGGAFGFINQCLFEVRC